MIILERVSARYDDRVGPSALREVSLTIGAGELVAVLGPNGAGKSTLVRVLTGLLPCASGTVSVLGARVSELDRSDIARRIAVVPQESDVAFGFTVREVVAMGRAPHQRGWLRASPEDEAHVIRALEDCDLTHLAERHARSLSGGEKKRVAIARALAQRTPVLLLDEPVAALDVRHQLALFDLLLARASEMACVCVLHDLNLAAQYATRILLLDAGNVVADGPPREVMTWARLKEVFRADLYVGLNDLTGAPFFLPMRR